ncbi:hypothetical protein BJY16_001441 [Actinoplanes octamycinicus]|uniref:Uncharacterized protein n=1 Tax=Actinoplanes octamycinicus TaxID=135948 RepID=A0A7W7GTI3_9ACTN|nr:hypothetical protein [Actinoplanes octamycinicus]MBB4737982.1 hypothetical protein [Actinoplanes octamycinicus]GIE58968.1 hypothetical protein Aoc01nite_43700 [Actinoplanes octamycinicus]
MMDLHSRLQHLAGPADETPAGVIEDDLARGRHAARRNRVVRVAAGSAFSVAAVAAALSLGPGLVGGPADKPPAAAQSGNGASASVELVSYTGEQPRLFTIDTVPQGFFIQSQNEYELVIAPEQAKTPDSAKPYLSDPTVYTGKIAVYLQNKDFTVEPDGDEELTIDGKPAALRYIHTDEGTAEEGPTVEATQVFVVQSPHVYLTVQFDASTGLTKEQMIKVAGGINLTAEAVAKAEKGYAAQTENPKTGKN